MKNAKEGKHVGFSSTLPCDNFNAEGKETVSHNNKGKIIIIDITQLVD